MKYLIQERIFTFANKFNIKDHQGRPQYKVVGEVFTFGNKLRLYDLDGRELIYIMEKPLRFLPEYRIYRNRGLVGRTKKELTFLKPYFTIESRLCKLNMKK